MNPNVSKRKNDGNNAILVFGKKGKKKPLIPPLVSMSPISCINIPMAREIQKSCEKEQGANRDRDSAIIRRGVIKQ